jgi:hypothetical protein
MEGSAEDVMPEFVLLGPCCYLSRLKVNFHRRHTMLIERKKE